MNGKKTNIRDSLIDYLEFQKSLGVKSVINVSLPKEEKAHRGIRSKSDLLDELKNSIGDCRRCRLYEERNNIVFGTGNPESDIMFVGEAPGRDEDMQGIPFVGRAGKLLTEMIRAMGFKRDDIYIANIIKCRPPQNRNPINDEIEMCEPFLIRQIEIINPGVIIALGTFAAQTLLKTEEKISQLRGNFHYYREIKLMPTFHPAYLLRNPGKKKESWTDLKKVLKEIGLPVPSVKKKN